MKLYTNILPVIEMWEHEKPPQTIEVGSTFVVLGVDTVGISVQTKENYNRKNSYALSFHPDIFDAAFKEVETL
jgi:hypothetical protein